jgi:hypothetical protein
MDRHESGRNRKKMVIVANYFAGERYGLLGPQLAATIISENSDYHCIVVATTRDDSPVLLKKALSDYFDVHRPIVAFSTIGGRSDLYQLAAELKAEGAVTILAGPQTGADFNGEEGYRRYPFRFQGFSDHFTFGIQGPAEQILPVLSDEETDFLRKSPGLLFLDKQKEIIQIPSKRWEEKFLSKISWDNLYRLEGAFLKSHAISSGQVLQQIGCPYAAKFRSVDIDYPAFLAKPSGHKVSVSLRGCTFCDVANDKRFHGNLKPNTVLRQMRNLPNNGHGRKIPFELINENPLPGLPGLIEAADRHQLKLSQVNLTLRADFFLRGIPLLREALLAAQKLNILILITSIGFESFDDRILHNLGKGVTVDTNLKAIAHLRKLKNEFPRNIGYLRSEGANHGWIHPTPWDSPETLENSNRCIQVNRLLEDILPDHSTPLIIHHASGLAEWIRAIEKKENIRFNRRGSIIEWWRCDDQFIL